MDDQFELERFVVAQDEHGTYTSATEELRRGRKTSHWMWFVFPQIVGLGHSEASRRFAISSLEEAQAYLKHPVLGPRLIECAGLVRDAHGLSADDVLGEVDAVKLHSSMTLFLRAAPHEPVFEQVLDQYFEGVPDPATEQRV